MTIRRTLTVFGLVSALGLGAAWAADPPKKGAADQGRNAEARTLILDADRIEGLTVRSKDGEDIGEIARVMFDTRTGRIPYVVVDAGGFLGIGETEYVVPWEAFQVRRGGGAWEGYVATVNAEEMKNAPKVADLERPDFDVVVFEFYRVVPGERMGAAGEASGEPRRSGGKSS